MNDSSYIIMLVSYRLFPVSDGNFIIKFET